MSSERQRERKRVRDRARGRREGKAMVEMQREDEAMSDTTSRSLVDRAQQNADEAQEHPVFARARKLPEPWRAHFAKSREEAETWTPVVRPRALASRVLAVATTRIEVAWAAYCDAVPGLNHDHEHEDVLAYGDKLPESWARALFPEFESVPYAD